MAIISRRNMETLQIPKPWIAEVQRKIGRNLLLLQHVETMLKTLLTQSRLAGATPEALERNRAERKKLIESSTLGMLAGKFTTEVLVGMPMDPDENEDEPKFLEGYVSFKYELTAEKDYVAQRTRSLQLIVDERNELVHHFLSKWNLMSEESAQAATLHLDQQHLRVAAEAKTLKSNLEALQRLARLQTNLMSSPEYEKQMEKMWLYGSKIVLLLVGMSRKAKQQDGWVRLIDADPLLKIKAPEDRASLKAMYGYDQLKPLLLATEVFDLRENLLPNGNSNVLFKLRHESQALFEVE